MKWAISQRADGHYFASTSEAEVCTPNGREIVSQNQDFVSFLALSLNLYGTANLGLTPYGIESGRLDFDIRGSNDRIIYSLSSAHDEGCKDPAFEKEQWMDLVNNGSPRTLAAMVTICGNIGWPEIAYLIAANARMPNVQWFKHICPLVQGDIDPLTAANPNYIKAIAEDIELPFAILLSNDNDLCANCSSCISHSDEFMVYRCAIYRQFAMVKRYIELGRLADEQDGYI